MRIRGARVMNLRDFKEIYFSLKMRKLKSGIGVSKKDLRESL